MKMLFVNTHFKKNTFSRLTSLMTTHLSDRLTLARYAIPNDPSPIRLIFLYLSILHQKKTGFKFDSTISAINAPCTIAYITMSLKIF